MPPARHPGLACAIHARCATLKAPGCRSAPEISWPVDVRDQPGLLRSPSQHRPRPRARSRRIHGCETREPAEMFARFLCRQRRDGHAEAAADHLGDLADRNAFLIDGMIGTALDSLLECEPIETRG